MNPLKEKIFHYSVRAWKYELAEGVWAIAGKTDRDNDLLSLKVSAPNDYWFHVKGMPGSHVILHAEDPDLIDKSLIKKAASVAAYHSKMRNAGVVPVNYTFAKFVSKPKKAKPGTVQIKNESVVKVRPEIPDII